MYCYCSLHTSLHKIISPQLLVVHSMGILWLPYGYSCYQITTHTTRETWWNCETFHISSYMHIQYNYAFPGAFVCSVMILLGSAKELDV